MRLDKLSMQFATSDTDEIGDVLEAYERLILDTLRGDHTLFTTAEGIESLWERSAPLLENPPAGQALRSGLLGPQRDPPADRAECVAPPVRARLAGTQVAALYITVAVWVLFEQGLRIRDAVRRKGGRGHDRSTRVWIALALGATFALAALARARESSLRIPGPHLVVGVVVIWAGLAIRAWAVVVLGSAFRTTVEVDADQRVVTDGPYRWIRHPSYTGLLLIVAGFGLALGNWLSLLICLALPLPAMLWRIQVEETELTRVLGEPYRDYEAGTKRLIPGVW